MESKDLKIEGKYLKAKFQKLFSLFDETKSAKI